MGNVIISTTDFKTWPLIARVGAGSSVGSACVNGIVMLSPNVMIASKTNGSDNGLYYTYYSYYTENNIESFTAESAYYAYFDN